MCCIALKAFNGLVLVFGVMLGHSVFCVIVTTVVVTMIPNVSMHAACLSSCCCEPLGPGRVRKCDDQYCQCSTSAHSTQTRVCYVVAGCQSYYAVMLCFTLHGFELDHMSICAAWVTITNRLFPLTPACNSCACSFDLLSILLFLVNCAVHACVSVSCTGLLICRPCVVSAGCCCGLHNTCYQSC